MSKLKKKLKTQGKNSKSRHFKDPWVPEKRIKSLIYMFKDKFLSLISFTMAVRQTIGIF